MRAAPVAALASRKADPLDVAVAAFRADVARWRTFVDGMAPRAEHDAIATHDANVAAHERAVAWTIAGLRDGTTSEGYARATVAIAQAVVEAALLAAEGPE